MILGIEREVGVLFQAFLAGNMLCLVYTGLYLIRKLVKHNGFFVALGDMAYWVFAGIYIFLRIQKVCNGNIRWYFVLGLLGGSLITYRFIRKIIGKYVDKSKKRE